MARRYLEEAAQAQVVHPRVYWELAYRRYLEVRAQPQEPDQRLSRAQVAQILEPLAVARTQSPSQALVYRLLADVWSQSAARPSAEELAVLNEYMQLFPLGASSSVSTASSTKIALLNAREGNCAQAARLMDQVSQLFAPDSSPAASAQKWGQLFRSAQTEQRSLTANEVQQIEAKLKTIPDVSDQIRLQRQAKNNLPSLRPRPPGVAPQKLSP